MEIPLQNLLNVVKTALRQLIVAYYPLNYL